MSGTSCLNRGWSSRAPLVLFCPLASRGTGGADDLLPSTARIRRYARRRGGVAARGTRAAAAEGRPHRIPRCNHGCGHRILAQTISRRAPRPRLFEGQNIFIDFRWAEGNYARLAEFAAELVRLRVDILITFGTPGTLAAKQTTTTLPIVMVVSGDAVATGIITSLARPGRNVTGSTFFNPELSAKRLEVFKDAYPSASRIAVLFNPDNPVDAYLVQAMELATKSLKLELQLFKARRADEIEGAISHARQAGANALAITDDAVFSAVYEKIAELATNNELPAIGSDTLARAGGLIGYGVNLPDIFTAGRISSTGFSRAPNPPTCRSSNRQSSF